MVGCAVFACWRATCGGFAFTDGVWGHLHMADHVILPTRLCSHVARPSLSEACLPRTHPAAHLVHPPRCPLTRTRTHLLTRTHTHPPPHPAHPPAHPPTHPSRPPGRLHAAHCGSGRGSSGGGDRPAGGRRRQERGVSGRESGDTDTPGGLRFFQYIPHTHCNCESVRVHVCVRLCVCVCVCVCVCAERGEAHLRCLRCPQNAPRLNYLPPSGSSAAAPRAAAGHHSAVCGQRQRPFGGAAGGRGGGGRRPRGGGGGCC